MQLGIVRRETVERLEAPERLQHEVAAAVRRHLAHLDAGEAFAQRRHPLGPVGGEVGRRERRRGGARHRPVVEARRASSSVSASSGCRSSPSARKMRAASGSSRSSSSRPRRHARQPGRPLDAVARQPDRGRRESRAAAASPKRRASASQPAGAPGTVAEPDAPLRHAVGRQRRRGRQASARVEPDQLAVRPHHREEVAADAAHVRVGDRQREVGRDRRIDRVAAVAQHLEPDLRRQRERRADGVAGEARHDRLSSRASTRRYVAMPRPISASRRDTATPKVGRVRNSSPRSSSAKTVRVLRGGDQVDGHARDDEPRPEPYRQTRRLRGPGGGAASAISRRKTPKRATTKPKPMRATPVRIHASSVRSSANATRGSRASGSMLVGGAGVADTR